MRMVGAADDNLPLRDPSIVMRLKRMGSFHQSRLSFMRVLLRRLKQENWQFDRPVFDLDENGVGTACYRARGPHRTYTLVAFSHDLPDEKRSDRVIADAWDATFTLFDGEPSSEDIARLSRNVPLQEAGRISGREFTLSRANRSVRMFNHVLDCLANGIQPDREEVERVGYLMRTTAVYGSGKFGAADRNVWATRPEFAGSFQPELLSVWLIRSFTVDLVEHLAFMKSPKSAVRLDAELRRRIGVGNSTGLGMAPFLINHATLIHSWVHARETAIARVRAIQTADEKTVAQFTSLLKRAWANANSWKTEHPYQHEKIGNLVHSLATAIEHADGEFFAQSLYPWDRLLRWAEAELCLEGQEQLASLVLEPYDDLVDDLAVTMSADENMPFRIDGNVRVADVIHQIEHDYGWIFDIDFSKRESDARVWYVSQEKLEPRLGERYEEMIEPYEQPLCPARDIARFHTDLVCFDPDEKLASFLMLYPGHRQAARRVQQVAHFAYAEVRDNTIAADMMPIDLLRCKLSFFGATKFDPRSDRWVRITMYQGAPFPDELTDCDPDDMAYPPLLPT